MDQGMKRKAEGEGSGSNDKRTKTKKQWKMPRRNDHGALQAKAIQPGDSGIWVTCNKGREGKCIGEMRDLFSEYAQTLYGDGDDDEPETGLGGVDNIENEIQAEIADMRHPAAVQLFTPVRLDVQCVIFFKTVAPVEPVKFVQKLCEDAMNDQQRKRTRFAMRLSPMTLVGRASVEGLEKVAIEVLAPHFHTDPVQPRKFAIRPTLRNHNILTRDGIIKRVASLVGPRHSVDLKNYDLLIIVEVYQNILGVSVVDNRFEGLKRFNLAEIFDPTPKEETATATATVEAAKHKEASTEAQEEAVEAPPMSTNQAEGPDTSMDLTTN